MASISAKEENVSMRMELYKRVFLNFALLISLSGILGGLLGAVMINRTTVNEAQQRVSLDLRSGWNVIENELDKLRLVATVLGGDPQVLSAFTPPGARIHNSRPGNRQKKMRI